MQALAVKPDGKQFAAAAGKSIKIWDLATGQAVKELQGHAGDVQSIAWRGDGGGLATGDKAHTIRLWKGDLTPGSRRSNHPAEAVLGLAYLPNNQQLVSAGSDGLARLWQLPVGRAANDRRQGAGRGIRALARRDQARDRRRRQGRPDLEPGRRQVDQGDLRRCSRSSRLRSSKMGRRSRRHSPTRACGSTRRRDGKEVKKIEALPAPITALAFRGDGGQLAVAGEDNMIRVINAADGKTIKELKGHQGRIHAPGLFTQGRQPAGLGLGRQDGQALGRQSGEDRPRFQRARRCRAQPERQPRRCQARHRLG